jgi:hypothetical protein
MITWAFVSERWAQKYFHFPAVVFLYSIYMIYFCGVLGYSAYLYEIYSHSEPHDWDANHHELMRRIWAVVVVFTTPEASVAPFHAK